MVIRKLTGHLTIFNYHGIRGWLWLTIGLPDPKERPETAILLLPQPECIPIMRFSGISRLQEVFFRGSFTLHFGTQNE
jgi:hypothetical protein